MMTPSKLRLPLVFLCAVLGATTVADSAFGQQIKVGRNVQVSLPQAERTHYEVMIAADPVTPLQLLACSIFRDRTGSPGTAVYSSTDGGNTWQLTLNSLAYAAVSYDPDVAFGTDGSAYFTSLSRPKDARLSLTNVFRSRDGGRSWDPPTVIPRNSANDRPYIIADTTGSKYNGRLYISVNGAARGTDNEGVPPLLTLNRSLDQGKHFEPPASRPVEEGSFFNNGNTAILSDGTIVTIYRQFFLLGDPHRLNEGIYAPSDVAGKPGWPNSKVRVISSSDGGETLSAAVTVSGSYVSWLSRWVGHIPVIAADHYNTPFKDRLYAAWVDMIEGRAKIMVSVSIDKGKTWFPPKVVSDDFDFPAPRKGPDDFMPTVTVNRDGVVGIMWYDRRNRPDNTGWDVRFTASLDGGDTFSPSVLVSESPMTQDRGRWNIIGQTQRLPRAPGSGLGFLIPHDRTVINLGGDTAGITADANGLFHPLWVDNRTGVEQVWTAAVSVAGKAQPNGSDRLSALQDLSDKMLVLFYESRYDDKHDTISMEVQLLNTSDRTLTGPIKLRVTSLQSDVAEGVTILNADNGLAGPGAVWDFTSTLRDNTLKPNEKSEIRKLAFHLPNPLPLKNGEEARHLIVKFEGRLLGNTQP